MTDQNLVAVNHVPFLIEQLSYCTEHTCNCQTKSVLWYILTTFPHKHTSLALSVSVFKRNYQKMKSLKVFEMSPTS